MKYILVVGLLMGAASYALEPAMVESDEDFNVADVVARLDEHMTNVQTWYQTSNTKKIVRTYTFDMSQLRSIVEVTHPDMIACFNAMEKEESLEPFFALWNQYRCSYTQSAQDQLLCKEVAFLDMHLYSTMLGQLQRSTTTRVTISEMLALYKIIASLPIYELLSLLDGIAREIIDLLDQTYQGEDSFFSWLWHNWWVPPLVISHTVSSLVEGITEIMIGDKPEHKEDDKDESKKTAMTCAIEH